MFAYRHAMLVDVDWVSVSMTDVRLLFKGLFKVATLIHIWVDRGTWVFQRLPVFLYGAPPRLKGIIRLFMLETSMCSHKLLWALA